MSPDRFNELTTRYGALRAGVVGDVCLDRYLEIDPCRDEISIETGLPVYNVARVRAQPGGAGTVINNLAALGAGVILPVSFRGDDGEGYELERALRALPGVVLDHMLTTTARRTFTYGKPLVVEPGQPPRELNRLDAKNWTPTPPEVEAVLIASVEAIAPVVDVLVVLDQVENPGTGVLTPPVLEAIGRVARAHPALPILGDSRPGFAGWPRLSFKMNAAELAAWLGQPAMLGVNEASAAARTLAASHGRPIFVTLSERGLVAADPDGTVVHVPALPVRGPIDIVGAGDAVTANLAMALAAGATLSEALELAALASSVVIHQLGTTGTAHVSDLRALLGAATS